MKRSKDSVYQRASAEQLIWLIDHVGACARALEKAHTAQHDGSGIDKPTRRVLEELNDAGPRPVPKLALALGVSRQAIQPLVDAQVAKGHVELLPNPARRRSPVVRLSEAGFNALAGLHAKEVEAAEQMAPRFLASHVAVARRTLANLIFAYTGAHPWELPRLRTGYAAIYSSEPAETTLNRHPVAGSGMWL